jgi:hypothetical protein
MKAISRWYFFQAGTQIKRPKSSSLQSGPYSPACWPARPGGLPANRRAEKTPCRTQKLGGRPGGDEFYDTDDYVLYKRVATIPLFPEGSEGTKTGGYTLLQREPCSLPQASADQPNAEPAGMQASPHERRWSVANGRRTGFSGSRLPYHRCGGKRQYNARKRQANLSTATQCSGTLKQACLKRLLIPD